MPRSSLLGIRQVRDLCIYFCAAAAPPRFMLPCPPLSRGREGGERRIRGAEMGFSRSWEQAHSTAYGARTMPGRVPGIGGLQEQNAMRGVGHAGFARATVYPPWCTTRGLDEPSPAQTHRKRPSTGSTLEAFRYYPAGAAAHLCPLGQVLNWRPGPGVPLVLAGTTVGLHATVG